MTRHYYVNPANTADISGPYQEGAKNVQLPDGRVISTIKHEPTWGVYLAVEDNATTPLYYTRQADTLDFVLDVGGAGIVGDERSRVQETRNFAQIPIDDLYEQKKREIYRKDDEATFNTTNTQLSTNWWLVTTEVARVRMSSITDALASGRTWPSNPDNYPWLPIYNAAAARDKLRRHQVTEAQHALLMEEKAIHDDSVGTATETSLSALEATYDDGNGNWQDLADHDADDSAAWGYPPYIVLDSESAAAAGRR